MINFSIHKLKAQFYKKFSWILLACREEFYKPQAILQATTVGLLVKREDWVLLSRGSVNFFILYADTLFYQVSLCRISNVLDLIFRFQLLLEKTFEFLSRIMCKWITIFGNLVPCNVNLSVRQESPYLDLIT